MDTLTMGCLIATGLATLIVLYFIYRHAKAGVRIREIADRLKAEIESTGAPVSAEIRETEHYGPSVFGDSYAGFSLTLLVDLDGKQYEISQNRVCALPGANLWDVPHAYVRIFSQVGTKIPVRVYRADPRYLVIDEQRLPEIF